MITVEGATHPSGGGHGHQSSHGDLRLNAAVFPANAIARRDPSLIPPQPYLPSPTVSSSASPSSTTRGTPEFHSRHTPRARCCTVPPHAQVREVGSLADRLSQWRFPL